MATPPSAQSQLVDGVGRPAPAWMRFFQDLAGNPAPMAVANVTASPFTYKANGEGTLVIGSGTITGVSLRRARASVAYPALPGGVPMSKGDVVTVTYTGAAPSATFVPS